MDLCADKVPVISPVSEVPGLILACGFSGHGFGIAPAVGTVCFHSWRFMSRRRWIFMNSRMTASGRKPEKLHDILPAEVPAV